ncbi:SDR family NAD(P)-dependent oxidoreductase [Hansschlegelia plantiphila]|uniref:Probable oxidoreductase n=1 Tax=Hansschlegelia plantiphila TaxID=374655 RepID=A0A9W6J144_9HYPH|nr:SDR family NAD(P)-dependent oxidoreductase [Hansschlegelia plantiphila]GLK67478.1 oxidoreductase [Hansschlegelia plantiphila]
MTRQFGATSTTDEVLEGVDLRGKRYLVTGVSSGMGVETARALVARGAYVVGAARNLAKAEVATGVVREAAQQQGAGFSVIELDLADLRSVRAAADGLVADGGTFDGVIANAGVMALPQGRTKDGFETQFATNFLGHFLLVNRIASLIREGGRVVTVSSNALRWADINIEDPNFERRPYDPWISYGGSKTAVVLFAVEFDRRHRDRGIRASSLMPGVSQTGLASHLSPDDLAALGKRIAAELGTSGQSFAFKTIPQVAATAIWSAVVADGDAIGGKYAQDCQIAPIDNAPGIRFGAMSHALDPERAKLLWAKAESLLGETF